LTGANLIASTSAGAAGDGVEFRHVSEKVCDTVVALSPELEGEVVLFPPEVVPVTSGEKDETEKTGVEGRDSGGVRRDDGAERGDETGIAMGRARLSSLHPSQRNELAQ
jgi:hypothetical protein